MLGQIAAHRARYMAAAQQYERLCITMLKRINHLLMLTLCNSHIATVRKIVGVDWIGALGLKLYRLDQGRTIAAFEDYTMKAVVQVKNLFRIAL